MSTKKRAREEDENDDFNTRLMKKQKESTSFHTVISVLFQNSEDQKQFQELFECIHSSQLFIDLGIYKDVSKHIAEFATGSIHECVDCKQEILTLPSDEPDTKYTIKDNEYFCVNCMENPESPEWNWDDDRCVECGQYIYIE